MKKEIIDLLDGYTDWERDELLNAIQIIIDKYF